MKLNNWTSDALVLLKSFGNLKLLVEMVGMVDEKVGELVNTAVERDFRVESAGR